MLGGGSCSSGNVCRLQRGGAGTSAASVRGVARYEGFHDRASSWSRQNKDIGGPDEDARITARDSPVELGPRRASSPGPPMERWWTALLLRRCLVSLSLVFVADRRTAERSRKIVRRGSAARRSAGTSLPHEARGHGRIGGRELASMLVEQGQSRVGRASAGGGTREAQPYIGVPIRRDSDCSRRAGWCGKRLRNQTPSSGRQRRSRRRRNDHRGGVRPGSDHRRDRGCGHVERFRVGSGLDNAVPVRRAT